MTAADEALVERDRLLPALTLVADQSALERALAHLPEPIGGTAHVRRLRYKPGSALHAAVEVVGDGSPSRWYLLAGYAPSGASKLAKDVAAAGPAAASSESGRWVIAPARTDRALGLHQSWPDGFDALGSGAAAYLPLVYNPRRRMVVSHPGPAGQQVSKVYASGTRRPRPEVLAELHGSGVPTPGVVLGRGGHVLTFDWVDGRPADLRLDAAAAVTSLRALQRSEVALSRNSLSPARIAGRARHAAHSVGGYLPELGDLALEVARRLATDLRSDDLGPTGTVHGDLSPDQLVMSGSTAVLLDLDHVRTGPLGWDAATWEAAQVAEGCTDPVPLPVDPPATSLLAAALTVRAVEPFRRRRAGWDATTRRMLLAARALLDGESARSRAEPAGRP